jgi:hypothetical protein
MWGHEKVESPNVPTYYTTRSGRRIYRGFIITSDLLAPTPEDTVEGILRIPEITSITVSTKPIDIVALNGIVLSNISEDTKFMIRVETTKGLIQLEVEATGDGFFMVTKLEPI